MGEFNGYFYAILVRIFDWILVEKKIELDHSRRTGASPIYNAQRAGSNFMYVLFMYVRRIFLTGADLSRLPPRVRERIAARDWANEILLRSIQLIVILLFCFIYVISPKTSPVGSFSPTPFVLLSYLMLSMFGLGWAYFRKPPDWLSYISILFDFALLYGLMIGFHIQYQQPSTFILKSPTLLYVFIFIALQALRFHPKFVIVAGLTAILGWACIVIYVTILNPAGKMLTRSYVEYLTSNSILIGAEIDKILSITFVTAILALTVNGSRNTLVTAVTESAAAADLGRFFDSSVAEKIRSSDELLVLGRAVKLSAAILLVDIRGFTAFAERCDADTVLRTLSSYQGRVLPLIDKHRGIVDKFIGDGIMTIFGVGSHSERFAYDAVSAAEAILSDFDGWAGNQDLVTQDGPLKIGIGIASGVVSWGVVGHGKRLEMTVIGPAVNLAAKLEKHNKTLGSSCVVDALTWQQARNQGYHGKLVATARQARLEGQKQPVEFVVLSTKSSGHKDDA